MLRAKLSAQGCCQSLLREWDGDGVLVVEVDADGPCLAVIPLRGWHGVEEDGVAFCGSVGGDLCLRVEGRQVCLFEQGCDAGDELLKSGAVACADKAAGVVAAVAEGDRAGDVLEEERNVTPVVDAEQRDDVERVLGLVGSDGADLALDAAAVDSVERERKNFGRGGLERRVVLVVVEDQKGRGQDGSDDEANEEQLAQIAGFLLGA